MGKMARGRDFGASQKLEDTLECLPEVGAGYGNAVPAEEPVVLEGLGLSSLDFGVLTAAVQKCRKGSRMQPSVLIKKASAAGYYGQGVGSTERTE